MNEAKLLYDVTAGVHDNWVYVLLILPVLIIAIPFVIIYVTLARVGKKKPSTAVSLGLLLGVGIFTFLLDGPLLISAIHESRLRASVVHGKYLSVIGKLASVRFEIFPVGRGPTPLFQESDVFTLLEGNSFEIECRPRFKQSPKERQPYQCLDAQIGDALTVDSAGSLGMHGSVPALRVWRNYTRQVE